MTLCHALVSEVTGDPTHLIVATYNQLTCMENASPSTACSREEITVLSLNPWHTLLDTSP